MITKTGTTTIVSDENYTGAAKPKGQDNHAHEPREALGVAEDIEYQNCGFIANGASEALKLSNAWRIKVTGGFSTGGVEDCVDIVRGGDITFQGHQFSRGAARQCVTLKGGARRVSFLDCLGLDLIVIGDYSKYDAQAVYPDGHTVKASPLTFARPGVREVYIRTAPGAREPKVIVLHGDKAGGVHSLKAPEIITKVYFWTRAKFFKESLPLSASEFVILPVEFSCVR